MIIQNLNNAKYTENMVALDYDWTLVNPKDGKTFPSNIDDWEWYSPMVPQKVKQYYEEGYMIVIFTNQSKPWKCDQIRMVLSQLNIPLFIVIARVKSEYKPNIMMFDEFHSHMDGTINKEKSFFIGDAIGRKSDFSDSDKVFADNIGIQCFTPEKIFMATTNYELRKIDLSDKSEIIIMVGYPGSGKTTIADEICKDELYFNIKGDQFKSNTPKMIKASLEHITEGKSIVFDATNSSIKKRKLYIDFAKKQGYCVRCIHVTTSPDISYKRNKCREDVKQVPRIAYSVYKKHYEEPTEEEGFKLLTI